MQNLDSKFYCIHTHKTKRKGKLFNLYRVFMIVNKHQLFLVFEQLSYAAFTHAGLTTRYRTEILYKSRFVLSRSRDYTGLCRR